MKIAKLIEQHFSVSNSIGLPLNLGDAYLCRNNKIYGNIRREVLRLGYSFSDEPNGAYLALPLSQLETILATKKIPYFDNVSVLEQIEQKIPAQANWDDVRDNLKKNFLFHESCHGVARELAQSIKNNNQVLSMLMEESFANTCELLAAVDAGEAIHRVFYECNSYTALFEAKSNLKNAMDEVGKSVFSKIIFFGYLHSNYLFNSIDEGQLNRIIEVSSPQALSPKQIKTIKALIKICFTLDSRFKEVTTRFYMRLSGVGKGLEQWAQADYFINFEKNSDYQSYVNKLALVIAT